MAEESRLYKQLLGRELSRSRRDASIDLDEVAEKLGRTTRTVRRFEDGDTLPDKLQLDAMCGLYGVSEHLRHRLENLCDLAKQPVWWAHLGPRPPATAAMLSMEDAAHRIQDYDAFGVPGLLQTAACVRAMVDAIDVDISPKRLEADVELRMARQANIWQAEKPPDAMFLIDEAVLSRLPGPPEAQRAQLGRLLAPPATATIQVVPFNAGPHPSLGAYRIFDLHFDSITTMKGVFVEGSVSGQGFVTEAEAEIARYELAFERTRRMALSVRESARRIEERMKGIEDD